MQIIEFYGLPGSGKSTLANKLIDEQRKMGKVVFTYEDYRQEYKNKESVIRGSLTKEGIQYIFFAVIFLSCSKLLFTADVLKRILYCLTFFAFYHDKKAKGDLVIMDEGIIQGVISAVFDYSDCNVGLERLGKIVESLSVIPIYIFVSAEQSNERIEKRAAYSHGRCDKIRNLKERKKVLDAERENFNRMHKILADKKIDLELHGTMPLEQQEQLIKNIFNQQTEEKNVCSCD